MKMNLLYRGLLSAALLSALPAAAAAQAAPAGADGGSEVEEIVVTAQKRVERLSDVPLSVAAVSGEQLASQGVSDARQLEKVVPGFTAQQTTFGTPVFTVRGIGFFDSALGASPTVTVYTDQVPLPFLTMARGASLDLERVEVLKGPQGTLFGQNSTGGAINYIAAKPTTTFRAGVRQDVGNFGVFNTEAFASGPITDTLGARIALRAENQGDWQKSQSRPGDHYGGKRFYNGRILLDWAPTETVKLELNLNGWHDRSQVQAPQFVEFRAQSARNPFNAAPYTALPLVTPAPNDARIADWDASRTQPSRSDFYQTALRGDVELPMGVTLTSITAYSDFKTRTFADLDGTAFDDIYYVVRGKLHSFSQETRLAGEVQGLKWVLGGAYQNDYVLENRLNLLNSSNNGVGPARYSAVENRSLQKVETFGVFASADFQLTEQVALQGGIRYTKQDRRFAGCLGDPGNGQLAAAFGGLSSTLSGSPTVIARGGCVTLNNTNPSLPANKPAPIVNSSLNEDNVSWRAGVNWKPDADTLVYGNVTKGYKAGNYTILPAAFASQLAPVTQESVLAYEVGAKTSLLDRRLQLEAAAFYYTYDDKQLLGTVFVPVFGNLPQLVNIPKSRVKGAEVNVTYRPLTGLTLRGGASYIESEVRRDPALPTNPFGQVVSFVGQSFPNTPKVQATADVQYEHPLSDSLDGFVGASLYSRSHAYAAFGELPQFRLPSYTLLDLRAGVAAPDGQWRVQVWARNVTDKFYLTGVQRPLDTITRFTGMPRTFGVTLTLRN